MHLTRFSYDLAYDKPRESAREGANSENNCLDVGYTSKVLHAQNDAVHVSVCACVYVCVCACVCACVCGLMMMRTRIGGRCPETLVSLTMIGDADRYCFLFCWHVVLPALHVNIDLAAVIWVSANTTGGRLRQTSEKLQILEIIQFSCHGLPAT